MPPIGRSLKRVVATCAGGVVCLLLLASVSAAAAPEFLTRMPEAGEPSSGAGLLDNPRAIAAEPVAGHIYVSDRRNFRVSEYTAWGLFVKSWGWDVAPDGAAGDTPIDELETCGPSQPEEVPNPGLCQKGTGGTGSGQFGLLAGGIEVDGDGNVWVGDLENLRVQKFSPAGKFLLMIGGDVNKTKVEAGAAAAERNVCPVAPADVCQAGIAGPGPSQLFNTVRNVIAYSAAENAILVGNEGEIQVFNLDGTYREEIPFEGPLSAFAGMPVNALDVEPTGDIYLSIVGEEDVFKLTSAGAPLSPGKPGESKFTAEVPQAVSVDHQGHVYIIDNPPHILADTEARVVKFDPTGTQLIPTKVEAEQELFFPYVPYQGPNLNGIGTNICAGSDEPGNLYVAAFKSGTVSYVDAFGTGPIGCEDPLQRPPVIGTQYATAVGSESAKVQAQVNPKFWPDATYYVEYGDGPCTTVGGCALQAPVSPALLTAQSTNRTLMTATVTLPGLEPGTAYRYRFVVESGGGGPVFGVDPDGEGPEEAIFEFGLERSFRTLNRPTPQEACPNDAFRKGPGAHLPDCRAYEMVSPLDKEGGDVALWKGKNAAPPFSFERNQSAPSGARFAFTSAYSFGDTEAAPYVSQHLAERRGGGWTSESISPPRSEIALQLDNTESEFQAFSEDLCTAWLRNNSVSPLAPGAIPAFPNLYRRDNCADPPTYTALSTVEPPNREASQYVRLLTWGASADATHAIFTANDELHEDAPTLSDEFELLLYEHTPDGLRFVCYLPGGVPSPIACGAGTPGGGARNAISADGSRIFWTSYSGSLGGSNTPGAPGPIYVRIDGTETREVSGSVAPDPAWYWTAADDGSKVIFAFESGPSKDELYEFDVDTETATLIAKGVEGPMGASEDASRIYFASTGDLDDTGPATSGDHNLYFYDANAGGGAGEFTFVMGLASRDVGGSGSVPSPIDEVPYERSARVTADGLHATFSAVAPPPSGYDNLEATSDEPAQEVYRYDAEEGDVACISCNPTGARPTGQNLGESSPYWMAARIQGWEVRNHAPRVITDDGSRVFFESFEALVPRDTNGTWDVYQWEEPGKGSCDVKDATYSTETAGCVDLISSGESKAKSTFLDADPTGDNIFFSTQSSLVGQDYGLNDVYVARALGGFPEPSSPPICEGEACQSPAAAPSPPSPASSSYRQPPRLERKPRPRCPKGKRKVKRAGKVRCAKKRRGAKARKRANRNRRAGR